MGLFSRDEQQDIAVSPRPAKLKGSAVLAAFNRAQRIVLVAEMRKEGVDTTNATEVIDFMVRRTRLTRKSK